MELQVLEKEYKDALERLAEMLNLNYVEMANFFGSVEDGAFSARRLKEFFTAPAVAETLDSIVRISDEYRCLRGEEHPAAASCR